MRFRALALLIGTLSFGLAGAEAFAAAAKKPQLDIAHPGTVAIIEQNGSFKYRHAETGFPLYVSDSDKPGVSTCVAGCARAWVPLAVDAADKNNVGNWTIITREDGTRQWAYKGQPVYTLFHDNVEKPIGNGVEGVWHFLEP